jgi:hypothetical protein
MVSPRSKMAHNFVLVRGSYTWYFVIVYVYQCCQLQANIFCQIKKEKFGRLHKNFGCRLSLPRKFFWSHSCVLGREFCPGRQHWCLDKKTRGPYSSEAPRTGSVTSFKTFPQKQHLHGRCLGLPVRAMTVAAEILIAQLHSQSKLTTAWHENRKIPYENKLLKAKEPAPNE